MKSREFEGHGVLFGLLGVFLGMVGTSGAQFSLQEPDAAAFSPARSRGVTVRFEPQLSYIVEDARPWDMSRNTVSLSTGGLDPEEDWDLIAMAQAGPREMEVPTTTGALLALPGKALDWRVEVTPASAAGAVSVSEAIVGTMPCLHMVVDRALAGEPGDQVQIRLVVDAANDVTVPRRSVAAGGESARFAQSIFLNGDSVSSVPLAHSTMGRARNGQVLPLPPGDVRVTYKIGVGLLAVPLVDLGVGVGQASILRLDHHGDRIPVISTFGGNALVYAPRRNTLTDRNDSIFSTADPLDPSPVVATRPAFSSLAPQLNEVVQDRVRVFRPRGRYERASTLPLGDRFLAYRVQRPNTVLTELPVYDHLTSADVFMQVRVLGLDQNNSFNPDHFADISLQGIPLPRMEWEGRTMAQRAQNITLPVMPNPANLELSHTVPSVVSISDLQNLLDVTLAWTGYPRIDSAGRGRVELGASGGARLVTLGGFPAGTTAATLMVLDITNPKAPVRLTAPVTFTDVSGTVAVQFEAPATAGVYFAQRIDFAEAPLEVIEAESLPDTTVLAESLSAVYVREPVLAAALEPLIISSGAGSVELDPQAAYNVYNGGQQAPEAIRFAVRDLLEAAPQREMLPRLVLVGDGTFDMRDYLGLITTPQIPFYLDSSLPQDDIPIENSIDYYFALLFGDDIFEDVQVARLPVKTPEELTIIIDRVLAHRAVEEELGGLARLGLFVADNPRPTEFVDYRVDSTTLAQMFLDSGKPSAVVELTGTREPAFSQMKDYLENSEFGVAMLMYKGHGNINNWADENLLVGNDIPNLNTEGSWPLVTTFTCLNSYYAFPGATTVPLGKRWITTPDNRGAIATITPTAPESYFPQLEFSVRFIEQLRQPVGFRPKTIGEGFTRTRIAYLTDLPGLGPTARTYLLFGEPGSSLTLPASVDYDFLRIY